MNTYAKESLATFSDVTVHRPVTKHVTSPSKGRQKCRPVPVLVHVGTGSCSLEPWTARSGQSGAAPMNIAQSMVAAPEDEQTDGDQSIELLSVVQQNFDLVISSGTTELLQHTNFLCYVKCKYCNLWSSRFLGPKKVAAA